MIIDKVIDLIAEQLGIEKTKINKDSLIIDDLGADSLDVIEMLMTLEDEYGITIPDDQISQVKTIDDVAKLIEKIKK